MNVEVSAPVDPPKTRKPSWPKVPADFVRAVLKGHSSLGLAFAAAIYLVCLTGSIAVFTREFQRWETPTLPRLSAVSTQAVERAYGTVVARAGGRLEHVFIALPGGDQTLLTVTPDTDRDDDKPWAADGEGRLVGQVASPWTEFLTTLHINLHLPRTWGLFLVGLIGVALLSSLISGLLAHPRVFRDAFHLRLGGSRRLQEADLHNRLGVWALPFHVVVSLTGALLGLTTLIVGVLGMAVFHGDVGKVYALFLPPEAKADARPAPAISLGPALAQAARLDPSGRIASIVVEHPTETGASVQVSLEDGSNRLADTDTFLFARGGKLLHAKRARDSNLGEAILGSIGQLHFGWFGGVLVKIAYGLLGLGLTYLAAGGVTVWLARRRDKGRPAPRWERVWTAVVWGQPLALAASALAIVILPAGPPGLALAGWGAATAAALVAALWLSPATLSRGGRLVTAALLLAVAAIHALTRPSDPIALTVDAVLAAIGLILLASLRLHRRLAIRAA